MELFRVFDIAGSAMSAQSLRLNLIASNLANAETVGASPGQAYRAREPVFAALMEALDGEFPLERQAPGVRVIGVVENRAPLRREYRPHHPLADEQGYVHLSNVNIIEEMANMISASRSYQTNVEVINTSKELLIRTLSLGR